MDILELHGLHISSLGEKVLEQESEQPDLKLHSLDQRRRDKS